MDEVSPATAQVQLAAVILKMIGLLEDAMLEVERSRNLSPAFNLLANAFKYLTDLSVRIAVLWPANEAQELVLDGMFGLKSAAADHFGNQHEELQPRMERHLRRLFRQRFRRCIKSYMRSIDDDATNYTVRQVRLSASPQLRLIQKCQAIFVRLLSDDNNLDDSDRDRRELDRSFHFEAAIIRAMNNVCTQLPTDFTLVGRVRPQFPTVEVDLVLCRGGWRLQVVSPSQSQQAEGDGHST